jgi:hypothetical protein
MTTAIIICCNKADEVLLPALQTNLAAVYPDANLFVAPCSKNPPTTTLPLTSQLYWRTPTITRDILQAMYLTGAQQVAKIDVDTWHLKPYLFEGQQSLRGIQWADNPHFILGIGYSLTQQALITLLAQEPCEKCNKIEEDQHLTWMARSRFPNDIHMLPVGTARKASTYTGQADACVLHLGCNPNPESRLMYQDALSGKLSPSS